jgi:hypothetical protein
MGVRRWRLRRGGVRHESQDPAVPGPLDQQLTQSYAASAAFTSRLESIFGCQWNQSVAGELLESDGLREVPTKRKYLSVQVRRKPRSAGGLAAGPICPGTNVNRRQDRGRYQCINSEFSWSVLRRPLDPIDNEGFNRPPRRFQSQAELLLHSREQIRIGMLRVCRRHIPPELGFVGRPLKIEIVPSRKAGFIHPPNGPARTAASPRPTHAGSRCGPPAEPRPAKEQKPAEAILQAMYPAPLPPASARSSRPSARRSGTPSPRDGPSG